MPRTNGRDSGEKFPPAVLVLLVFIASSLVFGRNQLAKGEELLATVPMSTKHFWKVIDETAKYESNPTQQMIVLRSLLASLEPNEIKSFDMAFEREILRSYKWDLWGAAYVIQGGASDDSFEYFRRWLISKGQSFFETALSSPDELAEMLPANVACSLEFEEIAYIAAEVWAMKTGTSPYDLESEFYDRPPLTVDFEPEGEPFLEDGAHLSGRYPKLWDRFGKHPIC